MNTYDTIVDVRQRLQRLELGMRTGKLGPHDNVLKRALVTHGCRLGKAAEQIATPVNGDGFHFDPDLVGVADGTIVSETGYQAADIFDFTAEHQQYWKCSTETLQRLRRVTDDTGHYLISSFYKQSDHDAMLQGLRLRVDPEIKGLVLCSGDTLIATFEPPCQCRYMQVKVTLPDSWTVECHDCGRDLTDEIKLTVSSAPG